MGPCPGYAAVRKLSGKCHFVVQFCTRKRSETYVFFSFVADLRQIYRTIWDNDGNIPCQYLTRKFIFPCSFTYHHFLFNNLVENHWRGPINYSTRFCSNIKHDCLTSIIIDYLPSNTTMHFCQTKTCIFLGNHT